MTDDEKQPDFRLELKNGALVPANRYTAERLEELPNGTPFRAQREKVKPSSEVIYAWRLARRITEEFKTPYTCEKDLLDHLKRAYGHHRVTRLVGRPDQGEAAVHTAPRSLNDFSRQGILLFLAFMEETIRTEIVPGLDIQRFMHSQPPRKMRRNDISVRPE